MDKATGKSIKYAIVRIPNTTIATSANSEGKFELWLTGGKNILVISHIGYNSDTLSIVTPKVFQDSAIFLNSSQKEKLLVKREPVSVSVLITEVIQNEKRMFAGLNDYEYNAYNRCVVLENNDVGIGSGSVNIDPGIIKRSFNLISNIWKSKPMRISGIDEFLVKGYYEKPDSYNEIVQDRNSRSALPRPLNSLLGTRMIQNLCSSELIFFDRPFPGPISSSALSYYKYSFTDTLQMDNESILKIYFEPADSNDPGLKGYLYVAGNSDCVLSIKANLNQTANAGNNFKSISLKQQYLNYNGSISLPVDFRVDAVSNYVGIIKAHYKYRALVNSYKINNSDLNPDLIYTGQPALTDPGPKDSIIISNHRTLPFTSEEKVAYERIDSIRSRPKGFFYKAGKVLSSRYRLGSHYSISGPLSIYHFNHVEGHTLSFTVAGDNLFENAANARITLSNGFSDKRFKESFSSSLYVDKYRNVMLSFDAYNKLATLFAKSDRYGSSASTIFSLLSSRDFRSYYYTNGFDFKIDAGVWKIMRFYIGYSNHVDHSAKTNTTFSLFGSSHRNFNNNNSLAFPDSVNPPIYDARLNTISFGVNFDFRDNVVENYLRRKESYGHSFISFGAGVVVSDPKNFGGDVAFVSYNGNITGEVNTFGTSSLGFTITGVYSNGPVPLQMQYALPGNVNSFGGRYTFRTLGVGNTFGDQVLTLSLEYNFRREIYRALPFGILRNLNFTSFFNAAYKNMSDKSAAIMPVPFTLLTRPLLETGFGIGYSSLPVSLEFSWRLTHIDRGNFRIGINTSIL